MKIAAYIAVLAFVAVLCIRQIGEPDVFWQVRTGQYIIEHLEVPDTDVFSYTYAGDPWTNVKWGTEVIMAIFTDALGMEALMLLQMIALFIIFFSLHGITLKLGEHFKIQKEELRPYVLIGFLLLFIFMAYRINGRPEMVSHVFTTLYLVLFLDYLIKPSWRIALLIPFQLFWANMHEAYGVGMVLIMIFIGAIILEKNIPGLASKEQRGRNNKPFLISAVLALLMPMIHPMGAKMILYPFNIYGQLGENQFTTENFGFRSAEFWQLPAFLYLLFAVMTIISIRKNFRSYESKGFRRMAETFGLPYILILAAFFILGLQAYRNMPYFAFAAFPLLVLYLRDMLTGLKKPYPVILALALLLVAYTGSGTFYKHFFVREKYGLRINPERTPIGAGEFLKKHKISGNGFVDYLSSAYFLWFLGDEYKSYVDLRDLDVFEQKFMENVLLSYQYPNAPVQGGKTLFQLMDEVDQFKYAVIVNKREFTPILRYLQKRKDFVLCYADPVSSVFLRRTEANRDIISDFENVRPESLFGRYRESKTPGWARAVSKVFWPFYTEKDFSRRNVEREALIYRRMIGQ